MRRREFITVLGGAVAWPLAARAQQPTMPVIGLLSTRSLVTDAPLIAVFQQGLRETGFVGDRNVVIDYRSAETVVTHPHGCQYMTHDVTAMSLAAVIDQPPIHWRLSSDRED